MRWRFTIAEIYEEEYRSEDDIRNTVINYLSNCVSCESLEMAKREGYAFIEDEKVLISGDILRRVLRAKGINRSPRKLAEILKDLKNPNELKRVSGDREYFWSFKLEKVDIDVDAKIGEENEDGD